MRILEAIEVSDLIVCFLSLETQFCSVTFVVSSVAIGDEKSDNDDTVGLREIE